jgi:hypothetical protein
LAGQEGRRLRRRCPLAGDVRLGGLGPPPTRVAMRDRSTLGLYRNEILAAACVYLTGFENKTDDDPDNPGTR